MTDSPSRRDILTSSVALAAGGNIIITYGGPQANAAIGTTAKLGLYPGTDGNNDIVWVCGKAATPTGVTGVTITTATTVSQAYLPTVCHL